MYFEDRVDMENRILTVVVPNFNNEKYIERCIESIFNQSYIEKIEIIVVDDCSTDQSIEIIEKLQNKRDNLRLIKHDKNKGVSEARNTGLYSVTTEYVTFIDGDDYYYNSQKLENELSVVLAHKQKFNKDIIAFSPVVDVSEDGHTVIRKHPLKKRKHPNGKSLEKMIALTVEMPRDYCLSKQMMIEVGGYNYPDNFYEDWDLLYRLAEKAEFYSTFNYGTAYRQTSNGLSKRNLDKHYKRIAELQHFYYSRLSLKGKILVACYYTIERIRVKIWNFLFNRKKNYRRNGG